MNAEIDESFWYFVDKIKNDCLYYMAQESNLTLQFAGTIHDSKLTVLELEDMLKKLGFQNNWKMRSMKHQKDSGMIYTFSVFINKEEN